MSHPGACPSQDMGGELKLHRSSGFSEVSLARPRFNNGVKRSISSSGTLLAISSLPLGEAALSTGGSGRGGARNRADRESHALTATQIANLGAAERHAVAIGLPFTRMLTIHWEAAGVPLAGMAQATGRFADLMGKAMARHGSGFAWLWTHENGDRKGGHCHLLAHVPADLVPVITRLQLGWLRRITGRPYLRRVICSKPIGGRLGLEVSNPALHAHNLEVVLGYVLKGASRDAASQFGLERVEPGGRVIGKRCGTSQNIGSKARKATAFAHSARAREMN
jgi:hypothetical protein